MCDGGLNDFLTPLVQCRAMNTALVFWTSSDILVILSTFMHFSLTLMKQKSPFLIPTYKRINLIVLGLGDLTSYVLLSVFNI